MSFDFGTTSTNGFSTFSDDEKLNYALKLALNRVQTWGKTPWYEEPSVLTSTLPNLTLKNKIPPGSEIQTYYIVDPVLGMATDRTVLNAIASNDYNTLTIRTIEGSTYSSGIPIRAHGENQTVSVPDPVPADPDNVATKLLLKGISKTMIAKYVYWKDELTGKVTKSDGSGTTTTVTSGTGTYPDDTPPFASFMTLSDSSVDDYVNDRRVSTMKKGGTYETLFNTLESLYSGLEIIHWSNIESDGTAPPSKRHPFFKVFIGLPTYSTYSDTLKAGFDNIGVGSSQSGDNIGFSNKLLEGAMGSINGYKFYLSTWNKNTSEFQSKKEDTYGDAILYFLSYSGFILNYGEQDILNGKSISVDDTSISIKYPPTISFLKYTGETFSDGIISQGDTLPDVVVATDKDLFINTYENTIYRFDGGIDGWIPVGGSSYTDLTGTPTIWNQNTTGNAATATKITTITNNNIVQLTGPQILINKTLTAPVLTAPVLGTPVSGNLEYCVFPTLNQNTTGNAATVSNGVYTSGDQTITGIKHFTQSGTGAIAKFSRPSYMDLLITGDYSQANFLVKSTEGINIAVDSVQPLYNSTKGIFIKSGGNVGIGNTGSVSYKLDVTGTVKATALMYGSTNVATELSLKAPLSNPTFTGTVKATALMYGSTNVATELSLKAPLSNPTFTGTFEAGGGNNAYGTNAVAMGHNNSSYAYSFAMGGSNFAGGQYSFAGGYANRPKTESSVCMGGFNTVELYADYGVAMGLENRVDTPASGYIYGCVALGHRAYVGGDIRFAVGVGSSPAGASNFPTGSTTGDGSGTNNNKFVIDKIGKVGIGTSSPYSKLTVGHSDVYSSSNLFTSGITAEKCYLGIGKQEHLANSKKIIGFGYIDNKNDYYPAYIGYQEIYVNPHNATKYTMGDLIFGTRESTQVYIEPTERMRIDSKGNVGIGTETVPNYYQEGHVKIGGKGVKLFVFSNAGTGVNDQTGYPSVSGLRIDHNQIMTNASEKLFLNRDNTGDVDICNGSLVVKETSMTVSNSLNLNYDQLWRTTGTLYLQYSTTGTKHVSICANGGNVGIGTSGPAYKLDIRGTGNQVINVYSNGTGDAYARFSQNNGGTSGALLYTGATSSYCYISSRYNFPTYFLTNNTTRMVIKSNGYVGIGTTGPVVPLDVKGQIYQNVGWRAYVNSSAAKGAGWGHSGDRITIKSERDIWTQGSLLLTSDARIKENIVEIDDGFSLQKVRDISCVWYNYKDKHSRGNMRVVGFIAQQVKEHLPEAVSIQTDVVPTEMRNLENISWNSFDMSSDLQDVSGVKHRFHVSNDISGNDERMKEVIGNSDNTFTFDTSYNNVFCYGKEVDDFHILDKNKLFALNFSATQEIDRIQQVEKIKLEAAETKLEEQTIKLAAAEVKLGAAEVKLGAAEVKLGAAEVKISTLESENTALKDKVAILKDRLDAIEARLTNGNL